MSRVRRGRGAHGILSALLLGALACGGSTGGEARRPPCEQEPPRAAEPATPDDLSARPLPPWFDDAKLGVMVHWGLYSVPGWAPTGLDPGDFIGTDPAALLRLLLTGERYLANNPYSEWYANTMAIDGSPTQRHHEETYGPDFVYDDFRADFDRASASWRADEWARLFATAGARYVVLVTKHHDGYALWPTQVDHPTRTSWHSERDHVGELTDAVRGRCMRMGLYYSGGLDWSVRPHVIAGPLDYLTSPPQGIDYIDYAGAQWRELIDRYRPAALWNDISWPLVSDPTPLFRDYYEAVPDGVINDRFSLIYGSVHHDFVTPEYRVTEEISERKTETVRGLGTSFAFNRNEAREDYLSGDELVWLLVDVVSKNGNLLINVGPRADGSIPASQIEALEDLGRWLSVNGEAIYGTRPWERSGDVTGAGDPMSFTRRGSVVYAILARDPSGSLVSLPADLRIRTAKLLGHGALEVVPSGPAAAVRWPASLPESPAYALRLELER